MSAGTLPDALPDAVNSAVPGAASTRPLALQASLTDTAAQLRAGQLSAEALTQRCQDQIAACSNSGFVRTRRSAAVSEARARDTALAAGAPVGALHGIPFGRKDMYFRDDDLCECKASRRSKFSSATT